MTPAAILRELLSTFSDARSPLSSSGAKGDGNGTPSMSLQWKHGSYQPLEDALKEMRSEGKQPMTNGILLELLWWHLVQTYLMSERKVIWKVGSRTVDSMVRQRRCTCDFRFTSDESFRKHIEQVHKPLAELTTVYTAEYQRVPQSRREECERLGIEWLVGWFKERGIEPRLPKEKS